MDMEEEAHGPRMQAVSEAATALAAVRAARTAVEGRPCGDATREERRFRGPRRAACRWNR